MSLSQFGWRGQGPELMVWRSLRRKGILVPAFSHAIAQTMLTGRSRRANGVTIVSLFSCSDMALLFP